MIYLSICLSKLTLAMRPGQTETQSLQVLEHYNVTCGQTYVS